MVKVQRSQPEAELYYPWAHTLNPVHVCRVCSGTCTAPERNSAHKSSTAGSAGSSSDSHTCASSDKTPERPWPSCCGNPPTARTLSSKTGNSSYSSHYQPLPVSFRSLERTSLASFQALPHRTNDLQFLRTEPATREHWQPKPALEFGEPGSIKIRADVEKQEAIVAVFKVRWRCSGPDLRAYFGT